MDSLNVISDKEFVPFLQSLGVETYQKSFEWMLNDDPDFAGVLRWLYNNLDHNNALSAREQCRYTEIEKKGHILPPEELESCLASIQEDYPGICIPGDQEAIDDLKLDIKKQKERLSLLEKHEEILKGLVNQNEQSKEELNVEITKLNSAHQQYLVDEKTLADECLTLAEEVESITEGIVDVVSNALNLYGSSHSDVEIAKKFFTFGPTDAYRQSQALFRSHCDLYVSRKFAKKQNQNEVINQELLCEATILEERLSDAIFAYIDSKAELCGEQAKLTLVTNYNNVHPSQVTICSVEAQSAVELLEQRECILQQQLQHAVRQYAETRTARVARTAALGALAVRRKIQNDLSYLLDSTQQALALDRVMYGALRHELRTVRKLMQFSAQLKRYLTEDSEAVRCRIESMNEICSEQQFCEQRLQSSDSLSLALCTVLGAETDSDLALLVKLYNSLQSDIKELNVSVDEAYKLREDALIAYKHSTKPLIDYIYDGCTKQPNCWNTAVSALTYSLKYNMEKVESEVLESSSLFSTVKHGDKQNLRKLWQWFLTDHSRLKAAINGIQSSNTK